MQIVSVTQFKAFNRGRNVTRAAIGVRKQATGPAEQLAGDMRALRFTISTGIVDREQDRIAVAGWDLAAFRRNPVVLWGHDAMRLPLGRAFDLGIEGAALKASVEFIPLDTPEGGPFAEAVYRLGQQGFIAATSVGFRPLKWDFTDDPERGADGWFPGIDFEAQELVEFSIVTVPANPETLIDAPGPGEGTAIAADTPPVTGEEVTSLSADAFNRMQAELTARLALNQESITARARRRRAFQLAMAMNG